MNSYQKQLIKNHKLFVKKVLKDAQETIDESIEDLEDGIKASESGSEVKIHTLAQTKSLLIQTGKSENAVWLSEDIDEVQAKLSQINMEISILESMEI